jgi:protocatechuate 3,4-dioxygenase beta subunit
MVACGSSRFTEGRRGVISGGMNRSLLALSPKARIEGRRNFLAWLAGGTALTAIGCVAGSEGEGGVLDPSPYGGDGEPDGEVVDTTEQGNHICSYTSRDARGPYFEPGSPVRATRIASTTEPGVPLVVEGRLIGPDCHRLLKNYAIDIWQADKNGNYYSGNTSSYRLRGKVKTDQMGRYRFETVLPGRYGDSAGIRPAHIHVSFLTPMGNVLLTSQLYFKGDPYLGPADYCTASGTCNSGDAKRQLVLSDATVWNRAGKKATFDAYLSRA